METSLHRQLKALYAGPDARTEVRVGRYRIDAVAEGELIEIQHAGLASIGRKVRDLLESHRVRVVKPIVVDKRIVRRRRRGGREVAVRRSSKHGRLLDLFDDLVHFTRVFPHPRLTIEALLVDVEEVRFPGHGRRRRWRSGDHQVEDQRLLSMRERREVATPDDLLALLDCALPAKFHSGDLAVALGVARHVAQRICYCLRRCGAVQVVGKQRNAWMYSLTEGVAARGEIASSAPSRGGRTAQAKRSHERGKASVRRGARRAA